MNIDTSIQNRVFISYAWEDAAVAEWVARKLMCFGYAIWIDKLFLKGGCTWPDDIDDAIKNQSFCMVHLLSRTSLNKENPSKERQLGLSLSKTRKGFLIPLNLDGVTPAELPWQLTDVQYIPFQEWDSGFAKLIEALESRGCPKKSVDEGVAQALRTYFPVNAVIAAPEKLYSNIFPVESIPSKLRVFRSDFRIERDIIDASDWPSYDLSASTFVAFVDPTPLLAKYSIRLVEIVPITQESINGVLVRNIVKSLLLRTLYAKAHSIGFKEDDKRNLIFPKAYDEGRYFKFATFAGGETKIGPHGYKTIRGQRINYSLSFKPTILFFDNRHHMVISLHVTPSYVSGELVESSRRIAIRKAIVKQWWNKQWYVRCAGIMARISGGEGTFSFGDSSETRIVFSSQPYIGESPSSLNDELISKLSKERSVSLEDYAEDVECEERGYEE